VLNLDSGEKVSTTTVADHRGGYLMEIEKLKIMKDNIQIRERNQQEFETNGLK
jgi:hypothetical protein